MYTENPRRDVVLFVKAFLTNQLATYFHPLYLQLGNRSGRSTPDEDPEATADYFRQCVRDYLDQLGLAESEGGAYFKGKKVLEYGPGDTLGVALLLYAYGVESVDCVDRFPLHQASSRSLRIYDALLQGLSGPARERANRAFNETGNPQSGFAPGAIAYRVTPDGLSERRAEYDLVLSRAVLQLVNRLDLTIGDIALALKPGGVSIHKVDLRSHGLDRDRPFDFLTWPDVLYRMMYSQKGRPNRWRVDKYQTLVRRAGLSFRKLTATGELSQSEIQQIRPALPRHLRDIPDDLLRWMGFWMVVERADHPFE